MPVETISDTAHWVAVYRALETERPDAIFRDPFARRLAGDKGEELLRSFPWGHANAWALVTRTAVMDELVAGAVRDGADLVLNLAAGLDARAWRMDLPASLRWVDVDLPGVLNYKTEALRDERPRCRYEPVALDLADRAGRCALFTRLGAEATKALVITEGLLIYLTPAQVAALAQDLHAPASFRAWLLELTSPTVHKLMRMRYGRKGAGIPNAPYQFTPEDGTGFFTEFGWREAVFRSAVEEGRRLHREMDGARLFRLLGRVYPPIRETFRRFLATVLLERV
jgi:methyltransferase (TIGR00027 family)